MKFRSAVPVVLVAVSIVVVVAWMLATRDGWGPDDGAGENARATPPLSGRSGRGISSREQPPPRPNDGALSAPAVVPGAGGTTTAPTAPAESVVPTRPAEPPGESGVGSLNVVVVDGDGHPLGGVRLTIQSPAGGGPEVPAVDLGAQGRTELRGLRPGRVVLELTSGDQRRLVDAVVAAGQVGEVSVRMTAAKAVAVEGGVQEVVVKETPPAGARGKDAAVGVVRGRVVEADEEKPLPGVEVRVNGVELSPTSTDDDGNFRLEGVGAGPQQILLSKDGFEFRTVDAAVVAGRETVVDAALSPAATLRVTLTRRDGRAFTGRFTLIVHRWIAPGVREGANHFLTADEKGTAVFREIAPGTCRVKVFAGEKVSGNGLQSEWADVEVPLGAAAVRLTLE